MRCSFVLCTQTHFDVVGHGPVPTYVTLLLYIAGHDSSLCASHYHLWSNWYLITAQVNTKPKLSSLYLTHIYGIMTSTMLSVTRVWKYPVLNCDAVVKHYAIKLEGSVVELIGFCILLRVYSLMLFLKTTVRNNVFCARFYSALLTTCFGRQSVAIFR
jgi:hypothetical protein